MNVKQVIVIRKDLKMRRGKEIVQGSHASMAWMSHKIRAYLKSWCPWRRLKLTKEQLIWIEESFAKVTVRVESEEELLEIERKAKEASLDVYLIIDSGRTEFRGVTTPTALAIGPHEVSKIDAITGNLQLY